jgi:hypothetical protein
MEIKLRQVCNFIYLYLLGPLIFVIHQRNAWQHQKHV